MSGWRGMVVLLVSSLVGATAMISWLLLGFASSSKRTTSLPQDRVASDLAYLTGYIELLGIMMASIFISGQWTARLLIGMSAAREIESSGRWRIVPLKAISGVLLVYSRALQWGDSARLWQDALVLGLGMLMILWAGFEAWTFWILPRLQKDGHPAA